MPRRQLAALPNHGDREEVRAALAGRVGRAQRRSATLGIDLLYVAVPMHAGAAAVLRLAESPAILAARRNAILLLSLLAACVALGLSALVVLWATGRHARRIRELEAATLRLGDETPTGRARETPADELGRLGRAINRMAEERRTRLDALVRERDERERMLAHLSDGVALLDGEGRVLRCNHSLAEILGVPEPAAEGTPFQSFARVPELEALAQSARAGGHAVEDDVRIWTPHPRLVHASAIPLGEASRGALLLVLRDLSEIEASSRVRQEFVANVSHELRTPLTSLRGYAETLLEGGLDDAEHREGFVRVIRDSAVRLEALVEDLLSLANLERPGAVARREPVDLRLLAERQAELWRPVAARAGLAFELVPGAPLPIEAEPARVEQVLANLIENAVEDTERGAVRVTLGAETGWAWCEVADTGPGIPLEDQPRVFERFYRVDKARSREKGGTGLGLSIVKHIVALHGGDVALDSAPGIGSRFRFRLPRSAD